MKELNLSQEIVIESIKGPNDQPIKFTRGKQILDALSTPVGQGVNYADMAKVMNLITKIKDAIDKGKNSIIIETIEHNTIVESLKAVKFIKVDEAIFKFIDGIINLPDYELPQ